MASHGLQVSWNPIQGAVPSPLSTITPAGGGGELLLPLVTLLATSPSLQAMALRLVSGSEGQGLRLPDEQRAQATAHATRGQEL